MERGRQGHPHGRHAEGVGQNVRLLFFTLFTANKNRDSQRLVRIGFKGIEVSRASIPHRPAMSEEAIKSWPRLGGTRLRHYHACSQQSRLPQLSCLWLGPDGYNTPRASSSPQWKPQRSQLGRSIRETLTEVKAVAKEAFLRDEARCLHLGGFGFRNSETDNV